MRSIGMAACALVVLGGGGLAPAAQAQGAPAAPDCGPGARSQIRTTLYFAQLRLSGRPIRAREWQGFLRDEVTPRFPDGLTAWDARGQWRSPSGRVDHEPSKVLVLVHPDSEAARAAVQEVIAVYRKAFDNESVLWESARVCVAG